MKPKQLVVVLAALVVLLVLAAFLSLRSGDSPANGAGLPVAADNRLDAPRDAAPLLAQPDTPDVARGHPTADPASTGPDAAEAPAADAGQASGVISWQIKGRIELESPDGLDLFSIMRSKETHISIYFMSHDSIAYVCKQMSGEIPADAPEYELVSDWWYARLDGDGTFRVAAEGDEVRWTTSPTEGMWRVMWPTAESDTEPFPNQATPQAYALLPGIAAPRVSGNVIDLGTVRLKLADVLQGDRWAAGRILHSSGKPLMTDREQLQLTGQQPGVEETYIGIRSDATGYFLEHIDPEYEVLPGMTWLMNELDPSTYDWASVSETLTPVRREGILYFGDIVVSSAAIAVTVSGTPLKPYHLEPDNIHTYAGVEQRPYVTVTVQSADGEYEHMLWTSEAWLLVPSGRMSWQAFVMMGLRPARPHSGVLAVAPGGMTALNLDFSFSETRRVRLVDPEGQPIKRSYTWIIKLADAHEEWRSSGYDSEFEVAVLEGHKTKLSIDRSGQEDLQWWVTTEDTEVVLTIVDKPLGTLEIVIPPAPANWPPDEQVWLMIYTESGGGGNGVKLQSTAHTVTRTHAEGTVSVWLKTQDTYGYVDDHMSGVDNVVVTSGETVRVELPPIPPLPYNFPIEGHLITVHCGGHPVIVKGDFEGKDGQFHHRDVNGDSNRHYSGLVGLRDGDRTIPFTITEPTAAHPRWQADLELPVRLVLTIRYGEQWPAGGDATLTSAEPDTSFTCMQFLKDGKASLFCPPGRATLTVRGRFGWRQTRDVVIERDKTLSVDLRPEQALLRVRFQSVDQDTWRLMRLVGEHYVFAHTLDPETRAYEAAMNPGKYRVEPTLPRAGVEPIDFELKAQEVREIELPDLGEKHPVRDVVLAFDVSQLGMRQYEPYVVVWIKTADASAASPWFTASGLSYQATITSEGLKVTLPVGVDLILTAILDADGNKDLLASRHLSTRIESDTRQIPVTLLPARHLHRDWDKANTRIRVAGHLLGMPYWLPVAGGTYEFEFFGTDGSLKHKATVTVNAGPDTATKLPIPEALRAQLKELRLLPAD